MLTDPMAHVAVLAGIIAAIFWLAGVARLCAELDRPGAAPWAAGIPKVKGSVSTTAIAMVKPGMAPASRPAATPTTISRMVWMCPTVAAAARPLSRIIASP